MTGWTDYGHEHKGPNKVYILLLYGWGLLHIIISKSCVLIGYLSGQDGPILPARDCLQCSHKSKILWHFVLAIKINPLLTKLVWSRCLDISLVLFLCMCL